MAEELVTEDDGLLAAETPEDEPETEEPEPQTGEPEPEPESEPEQQPPAVARSRRDARIAAVLEEREAERRRAQRLEEDLERERRARLEAENVARRKVEEDESNLSYDERLYRHQVRHEQKLEERIRNSEMRMADRADHADYVSKAAGNPIFGRYEARVEEKLREMQRQGQSAPREAILRYLIGEDALLPKARSAVSRQKADAAERVRNARGKPVGARSDASGERTKSGNRLQELEKRLDGVPL